MKHKLINEENHWEYLERKFRFIGQFEFGQVFEDLPSFEAIIDYLAVLDHYDVDFANDVVSCINEGDEAKVWNEFIDKHSIPWDKF